MSVAQTPEPTDLVPQEQWPRVRRNATDLPQATFRTALRGFDRDEVRTLLEDVAADYRALQMKNAALERQLTSLEGVVIAYLRDEGPARGAVLAAQPQGDHTLHRANADAEAILSRARAQAEEIVARAHARIRTVEQLEQEQKRFRTVVGATISDLLTVMTMTRRDQDGDGPQHERVAKELAAKKILIDAPVSRPAITGEVAQTPAPAAPNSAKSAPPVRYDADQMRRRDGVATGSGPANTPSARKTSMALTDHYAGNGKIAVAQPPSESIDTVERIKTMLKSLDVALVEIPALPHE